MAAPTTLSRRDFAVPTVTPVSCPISASLGVLGRKWALAVLRDVAFYKSVRFSDILRNNPGLTPRMLSFRLRELRKENFIRRVPHNPDENGVTYELTEKGTDVIPILTAFLSFGMKHHADTVFEDGKPRTLGQVLPGAQCELLGPLARYAAEGDGLARTGKRPK